MASNTKLYVGNLPPNCTDSQVRELFSKFGKIVECDVIKDYAFVHFAESKNAMVAVTKMNNTKWSGTILRVQPSYSSTKLYVGNLPRGSNEDSVRNLFSTIGKVVACDIIKEFGFVHFASTSEALQAVERLNDKEWNGSTLKVQPSHSKVHLKPGMGGRGECIRCGKTGHLCRDCPIVPARDIKGSDIQAKSTTTLHNLSREISAMNGSIGDLYSFISNYSSLSKYRDSNSYNDSTMDNNTEITYPKYSMRNNYNGENSSRYHHSNSDDYNSDVYTSSNKRNPYYDNYPPPPVAPSRYRHRPYPTANERRLAPSSMSERRLASSSMSQRRLASSSMSESKPRSLLSSSHSLSSSHPGSNSNSRDMNPYFRPPPEYYEYRRKTMGNPPFARSREH